MKEYTTEQLRIELARRQDTVIIPSAKLADVFVTRSGAMLQFTVSCVDKRTLSDYDLYTFHQLVSDAIVCYEAEKGQ